MSYSNINKPITFCETTTSGAKLVRFSNIEDIFWYDEPENNPKGYSVVHYKSAEIKYYMDKRYVINNVKQNIINKARHNLKRDKEFLELLYKAKSAKREFSLNRFGGNLSMSHYASNSEKIFKRGTPGAKKLTLDIAFQVGTFVNGNYTKSFTKILKTVFLCQAMGIHLNIDVFDSDVAGINNGPAYVICNIAKSHEKLNLKKLLIPSHEQFFRYTLFNGYSGYEDNENTSIRGFLPTRTIKKDLSERYDVIGGNLLTKEDDEKYGMVSKVIKIGLKNG